MKQNSPALRIAGSGIALAVVAALVTGCSDDKSGANGGATPSKSNVTFTGNPVTVYTSAPIGSQMGDVPQLAKGAEAAASAINSRGGLNGHELIIKSCSDSDANAEIKCARDAAADKALAFTGSMFLLNPAGAQEVLASNKIPNVANVAVQPSEYGQAINFPIDAAAFTLLGCVPMAPKASGKKKVASALSDTPVAQQIQGTIQQIATRSGTEYGGAVLIPVTETDYTAAVKQIGDKKAEIVVVGLSPAVMPSFVSAATSIGEDFTYCGANSALPADVVESLGVTDVYNGATFPTLADVDKYQLFKQFKEEWLAAGNSKDALAVNTDNSLRAWLGLHIIEQAAKSVQGELSSETLLAALNATTVDLQGLTPTIDFSKPLPAPGFERLFNDQVRLIKWDSDEKQFVSTDVDPVRVLQLMAG